MAYRKNDLKTIAICAWALALVLMITYVSCRKRMTIKPVSYPLASKQRLVRVLLFDNINKVTLKADSDITVAGENGAEAVFEKDRKLQAIRTGEGIKIESSVYDTSVLIKTSPTSAISVNDEYFRGSIFLHFSNPSGGFKVVNEVDIEIYLAGVVGAEMPSYWHQQALRAQAVASRTYALAIKNRFGKYRAYDLKRTQANQVYLGLAGENARIWKAVKATSGQVLKCSQNGKVDIFPAYFSSVCGGHTENSANVFGDSYRPLEGVDCPYCRKIALKRFYNWKAVSYEMSEIRSRLFTRYPVLKKMEKIKDIQVRKESRYSDFSRITSIAIIGNDDSKDTLRGEDFRLAVDPTGSRIKSAAFKLRKDGDTYRFVQGRGYGHAVGMCQYGARQMAKMNNDYKDILRYYYPQAIIEAMEGYGQ